MQRPIFLVGFMGSGKTTWGKKLANALSIPFIDLDHEIVNRIGMDIPSYFKLHGEDKFRQLESAMMMEQADRMGIISTGGGTPCYFQNMEWLLEHGTVVYLKHSPKSLYSRLSKSDIQKRPALGGLQGEELLNFISQKLEEREPFYGQAPIIVDQINTSLDELLTIIQQHEITK